MRSPITKLTLTLLALVASLCAFAQDEAEETTLTLKQSEGTFYRYGEASTAQWTSVWESQTTPIVTINNADGSDTNNLSQDSSLEGFILAEGGSHSSFSYNVSVPSGYAITSMSFNIKGSASDITVTVGDDVTISVTTAAQAVTVSDLSSHSVTIGVSSSNGSNENVTIYDWTLTVVPVEVDTDPHIIISTEEEQHWYYVYSTSTKSYCQGKVWYYDDGGAILFGTKSFQPAYLWSFWKADGTTNSEEEDYSKMAIKNYTGQWLKTNSNQFTLSSDPTYGYSVAYYDEDCFSIEDANPSSNGKYLHAQESGTILVHWSLDTGNASMWNFEEVDVSDADVQLESTSVEQGKVTTGIGNKNVPIIRSTMTFAGLDGGVTLTSVSGKIKATDLSDVTAVRAYIASNSRELYIDDPDNSIPWREENGTLWAEGTIDSDGNYTIEGNGLTFTSGSQYLWICLDISDEATEGNTVDATISSYTLNNETIAESNGDPTYSATIFLTESAPLMPMDMGTLYYRIPAITTTADGSRIVILSDDRTNTNGDLPTHVYVVAQYSDDGGKTWSEPVNVAGKANTGGDYGHGDASLITNRITGDIIGIMTSSPSGYGFNNAGSVAEVAGKEQAWKTIVSHDNGETWEAPVDHTKELYGKDSPNANWFAGFSGSGAGLQKRDGTLVSPFANKEENTTTGAVSWNYYNFMSKDGGETWYVSGTSGTTSCDEPKVLERNNGDLAISVRQTGYNFYNYTSDDGETWHNAAQTRFTSGISGNACDGDYMVWCSTIDGNPWNIALQTCPNSSSRENVSIALSTDEGASFETVKTICPRGSAYSSATVLPDGTLGVYYEENGIYGGFTMRFVRFSLDWASGGKYKFTDDAPFHRIQTNVNYEMPDYSWNTIILPFDAELPDDLTAYACLDSTVNYWENDTLKTAILIEKLDSTTLKGLTPYVVAGPEGTYNFSRPCEEWYAQELPEDCIYKEGALRGVFVDSLKVFGNDSTIYSNFRNLPNLGGVGLHRTIANAYTFSPAYTCYAELSDKSDKMLFAKEAEEIATGITGTKEAAPLASTQKMYNLNGVPRREGEKGIFVMEGKTVLIK